MDLMSVCRTCMSSTSLNPIFPLPEAHERFSDAIYLITGIKVILNDGLPQKMCIDCLKQVNDAMKFRAKCKETEETILKIKSEIRRAVRHNESIVNYRSDFIREIKVGNRWVKIEPTKNITVDNDEQPLMHLLNTESDIQNIYITDETGEHMIPLEMLKVEIDTSGVHGNSYTEDTVNDPEDTNDTEQNYAVDTLEGAIDEQEDADLDQDDTALVQDDTVFDEDAINDQEDAVVDQEDAVVDQEDAVEDQEDAVEDQEDPVNELEETIANPEDDNNPEYTIVDIQEKVSQENTVDETEVTFDESEDTNNESQDSVNKQEDAVNVPKDNYEDPQPSDSLKTYYILKNEALSPDNVELNENEADSAENAEFDNINVSENQEIVVMDNRESLYVIDMSNPSSKRVTCKLCQKNLSIRSIDLHLSKSHPGADGRRVKCQLCDNFVIRERMVQHRLVVHGAEAFQCRYCKWEFEKEDALIEHVVTCTAKKKRKACDSGREMVECEVCHKKMQKASLRLHTAMTHAGLRPVCDHCGKSFGNKFRLNEHYRAKHGYEKFQCSYCEFQSASSLALRNHERRHRGEKPYVCERCGAKFHAAYLLTQHRHSHRTERKFRCEICAVCFKTNNGLHSHRRSCHGGVRRLRSGRARDPSDPPSQINDL